jgi:hypothetical protein
MTRRKKLDELSETRRHYHEAPQRGRAATETRNISRKGAKAAKSENKSEEFLPDNSFLPSELGVPFDLAQDMLCALARVNSSVRAF